MTLILEIFERNFYVERIHSKIIYDLRKLNTPAEELLL